MYSISKLFFALWYKSSHLNNFFAMPAVQWRQLTNWIESFIECTLHKGNWISFYPFQNDSLSWKNIFENFMTQLSLPCKKIMFILHSKFRIFGGLIICCNLLMWVRRKLSQPVSFSSQTTGWTIFWSSILILISLLFHGIL